MQVVRHEIEPVDILLMLGDVEVLQVPVGCGQGNCVTVFAFERSLDVFGQQHKVDRIFRASASVI